MITETGKRAKDATISDLGIKNAIAHWNLSPKELVDIAIDNQQAKKTSTGAININTGEFTGRSPKDRIIVLDKITDTRNLGSISRVVEAVEADAIVIPKKGSALITSDAIKTSAGALNYVPVCKVESLSYTCKTLKKSGLKIISCTEKGEELVYDLDYNCPVAIILGSEKNGISKNLLELSDHKIKIPMYGKIGSLNVSNSTTIILYEIIKQ